MFGRGTLLTDEKKAGLREEFSEKKSRTLFFPLMGANPSALTAFLWPFPRLLAHLKSDLVKVFEGFTRMVMFV